MVNLAKSSSNKIPSNLLGKIIQVSNLIFIIYLIYSLQQSNPITLDKFKEIRNIAYYFYMACFLILGIVMILNKRPPSAVVAGQQSDLSKKLLPNLVVNLILTTYAFYIATLVIDLLKLLNLL